MTKPSRITITITITIALVAILICASSSDARRRRHRSPTPTPTPSATVSPSPTASVSPSPSATPSPTASPAAWTDAVYGTAPDGTVLHWAVATPDKTKFGQGPWPCLLLIHGGGWAQGDYKTPEHSGGDDFVANGFACFSPNYRLTSALLPGQPKPIGWPGQWDDIKMAAAALRASASYNQGKVGFYGGSAGAYFVCMGVATGLADYGVSLSAATDLTATDGNDVFNRNVADYVTPDKAKEASPVTYVTSSSKPLLLIAFERDDMPPSQFNNMKAAMSAAGAPVTPDLLAGRGHSFQEGWPAAKDAIIQFVLTNRE